MTGKDYERELDAAADALADKINSISRSVRDRIEGQRAHLLGATG